MYYFGIIKNKHLEILTEYHFCAYYFIDKGNDLFSWRIHVISYLYLELEYNLP